MSGGGKNDNTKQVRIVNVTDKTLKCPLGGGKVFQLCLQGAGIAFFSPGPCVYLLRSPLRASFLRIAAGKMGATENMG